MCFWLCLGSSRAEMHPSKSRLFHGDAGQRGPSPLASMRRAICAAHRAEKSLVELPQVLSGWMVDEERTRMRTILRWIRCHLVCFE